VVHRGPATRFGWAAAATASVVERESHVTTLSEHVRTLQTAFESVEVERDETVLLLARYTGDPGQELVRASRDALLGVDGTTTFEWGAVAGSRNRGRRGRCGLERERARGLHAVHRVAGERHGRASASVWLVDSRGLTHDDGRPARVSGGVFNVAAADVDPVTGEVIMPIRIDPE